MRRDLDADRYRDHVKSLGRGVAQVVNKSAVPYVSGKGDRLTQMFAPPAPQLAEMRAFGQVGTLFAIVTKCANATAQVEWKLWRKAKSGKQEDRTQVTQHLALNIWNKPNDFYTRQEFVESTGQHQELVGEQWWVISRNPLSSLPLELWPVRPDKMRPIPDKENYLVGYVYTGPSNEQIPLEKDQVIMLRSPDPMDPYRGMGPVQTILPDLRASNMAAQYVANFFTNSAEPGGIIEVDERLSDDEFDEMTTRWREQHQGVSNAHRVAVIEKGHWVDRKYTMKDMQFTELRTASSEMIREAFGFPKPLLGTTDDVNRANAEAAEYVFAKWLIVPRLQRIKEALNNDFLPLFYPPGAVPDVEFDYDTPVPEDKEFEATNRKALADTAKVYIDLGFNEAQVLEMLNIPAMDFSKPEPAPNPFAAPPATDPNAAPADPEPPPAGSASNRARHWPTAAAALPDEQHPDLSGVQASWEQHLDALIKSWTDITTAQKNDLMAQLHRIVSSGTTNDLLTLTAASSAGAAALQQAMIQVGGEAAAHVVAEAEDQGQTIHAVPPRVDGLTEIALATAGLLASGLSFSTIREALRVWNKADTADAVVSKVRSTLDTLTDAQPKALLGSALTQAQRQGRMNTLLAAPTTAWYASEQLDSNTCEPCRRVNGKWLGNSIIENVNRLYPTGGYIDCLGRDRCRGMVVGVWRPEQVGDR